jgi:hypothetical protein
MSKAKAKTENARSGFKDLLGSDVKPTIQKVQPDKKKSSTNYNDEKNETQLMVWIPVDLMVKLKTKTVIDRKTMKDIIIEVLENNL